MYRIVIVDADSNVCYSIARAVDWNGLGFHIAATFSDGEAAKEYLKRTPADALLLSAELPRITGMDVAAFIHQNLPDCCVVMMSANGDYDLLKRAMQYGVCDHIRKPVDPEELRRSLELVCKKLGRSKRAHEPSRQLHKEYNSSAALVQRVMAYVDQHILESVSLDAVSSQMHISTSHLIRIFKKETGYTYLEYVTKKKMEKAAEYFQKENLKVHEVSEKLGYRSTRHFSTLFYKQFGCYPSEYFDTFTPD